MKGYTPTVKQVAEGKATFVDPEQGREHTVTSAVYRDFVCRDAITAPETDVPNWVGEGTEVVFVENGNVMKSFVIEDVREIDLTDEIYQSIPNEWNFSAITVYSY